MAELPSIHNTRSLQQWDIINKHINFIGKRVIDLGCGYGDILFRCWEWAANCTAIDDSLDHQMEKRLRDFAQNEGFTFYNTDIEDLLLTWQPEKFDVAICFSVLPYILDTDAVLKWMSQYAQVSLIECQYYGDGPGFEWLQNDDEMRLWLQDFWSSTEIIGKTLVKERHKYRMIWMCQNE